MNIIIMHKAVVSHFMPLVDGVSTPSKNGRNLSGLVVVRLGHFSLASAAILDGVSEEVVQYEIDEKDRVPLIGEKVECIGIKLYVLCRAPEDTKGPVQKAHVQPQEPCRDAVGILQAHDVAHSIVLSASVEFSAVRRVILRNFGTPMHVTAIYVYLSPA